MPQRFETSSKETPFPDDPNCIDLTSILFLFVQRIKPLHVKIILLLIHLPVEIW